MAQKQNDSNRRISLEISKELEGGVYINHALIAHTQKEFMIDFGLLLPSGKIKIQSRIITNPYDAKAILLALKENIENFERKFGEIPVPKQSAPPSTLVH